MSRISYMGQMLGGVPGGALATPALQPGQFAFMPSLGTASLPTLAVAGAGGAGGGAAVTPWVSVPATYGANMFSTMAPAGTWPNTGLMTTASSVATAPVLASGTAAPSGVVLAGVGPVSSPMPLSLAATSPTGIVTYQAYAPTITSGLAAVPDGTVVAQGGLAVVGSAVSNLSSWSRRGPLQYAGAYNGPAATSVMPAVSAGYMAHARIGSAGCPFVPVLPGAACGDGWGSQYGTW